MLTHPKFPKFVGIISLLILSAVLLTSCGGGIPVNGWLGVSADSDVAFLSAGSQVIAVNIASGAEVWRFPAKAEANVAFFAPGAVADGKLFLGDYANTLYAVDTKTGNQLWKFEQIKGKGRFIGGPLVVGNMVLAPSTDHFLYALDLNGTLKWKFEARNVLWGKPASDGKLVYLPGMDHYVYAVDLATGKKVWEADMGAAVVNGPLLNDGVLYVPNLGQQLLAIDSANGKTLWRAKLEGSLWDTPVFADGSIFFGTDKGKLYSMSVDQGKVNWTSDAGSTVTASPVLLKDAVVFVTEAGDVLSIKLTGEKTWSRPLGTKLHSSPVISTEKILVPRATGDKSLLTTFDFNGNQGWDFTPAK